MECYKEVLHMLDNVYASSTYSQDCTTDKKWSSSDNIENTDLKSNILVSVGNLFTCLLHISPVGDVYVMLHQRMSTQS